MLTAPLAQAAGTNDFSFGATPVASPSTTVDTNVGATTEPGEQIPCGAIGSTLWYQLPASTSGWITVDGLGSNFDTVIAIYSSPTPAALATTMTPVTCDDDYYGLISSVQFNADPTQFYYIQFGGFNGAQGTIQMNVNGGSTVGPSVNPQTQDNGNGTCDVYNDANGNGVEDPGENVATVPCSVKLPNYQVANNGDGSCTLYDDQNGNGQVDGGEQVATFPCSVTLPNPQVANNPDGTCTVYNDQNGNGQVDAGEPIATAPCSAPSTIPVNVPPVSESVPIPGISTPSVPSETVNTPPVTTPATCTASICTNPTTVPSQQVGPTPDVPAQSTPPLPQECVPLVICVGPVAPQPLTPEVPPQGPFSTPPVTAPAVCAAAAPLCLPPTTIVPPQSITTPGQGPIPITPPIVVSVSSTGLSGLITPNVGQFSSIGPFNEQVGPVPVTLCPSTCPVPVPPGTTLDGSITVTVTVGSQVFSETVPVHV